MIFTGNPYNPYRQVDQKKKEKKEKISDEMSDKDIMIASDAINILKQWNFENGNRLGDGVDVISSTFTYMLTMSLAAVMAVRTYILSPIECHAPVTFGGTNFGSYVNNYCFVEGSVGVKNSKMEAEFPQSEEEWIKASKDGYIGYYPWIPLYLSVMAMIPFMINLFWKIFYCRRIGTDLQGLLEMAQKAQLKIGEERRKLVEAISILIADTLWKNREYRNGRVTRLKNAFFETLGFGFFSKRFGSWLNFWYFIVKLAYLGSHILAICMMHKFLNIGSEYRLFGFQVFQNIMNGKFWDSTLIFPRVTWCNVPIKHNKINFNLAQCVLPGNLFSEIIFALLWIWHAIALVPMSLSIIRYTFDTFNGNDKERHITKWLTISGEIEFPDPSLKKQFYLFGKNFLRQDGYFTLRMFESAVGTAVTCDIARQLWLIQKKQLATRAIRSPEESQNTVIEMDSLDNVARVSRNDEAKIPFVDDDGDSKTSSGGSTEPIRS